MTEAEVIMFIEENWLLVKICVAFGAGTGAGLSTWWGIGWLSRKFKPNQIPQNK